MKEVIEFVFTVVAGVVFVLNLPLLIDIITGITLKKFVKTPAKNTVTGDTPQQRVREFKCKMNGCVTTARYYVGMPQATCRRCGHKNSCARSEIPEWSEPDD
jgi:hypothetical protein